MTHILYLGAINKLTGEYVYPKNANKKDKYECPDCGDNLILCHGEIINPYYRHEADRINPCYYYSKPTESQIHKDAKFLLKNLLERKIPISFIRNCCCCKKNEEYEIPEISETSNIQMEYRFEYNGLKIVDVVYLDDGEILCIFEICNTHKTCSENRPEPWFEIDAETLIKMANDNSLTSLQIPCIRCEKCDDCIEKEKNKLILEVQHNNLIKVQKLQKQLEEAEEYNIKHEHWLINDGKDTTKYEIPLRNIRDEIELKLIQNNIKYINNNDEYFVINNKTTEEQIIIKSIVRFEYCGKLYKLIWNDLINWYNNCYSFNTIACCIISTNSINELNKYIEKKEIHTITEILQNLEKNSMLCKPHYGVNFSFKKYISSELLLECKFIQRQIEYTIQYTAGSNIYKIKLPDKNEYIKYSMASKKIYMNKKWHDNVDLDSVLYGKIYLIIPYSDKDQIKSYGGIWDNTQKKWYISNNNENIAIILNKWKEIKI